MKECFSKWETIIIESSLINSMYSTLCVVIVHKMKEHHEFRRIQKTKFKHRFIRVLVKQQLLCSDSGYSSADCGRIWHKHSCSVASTPSYWEKKTFKYNKLHKTFDFIKQITALSPFGKNL